MAYVLIDRHDLAFHRFDGTLLLAGGNPAR